MHVVDSLTLGDTVPSTKTAIALLDSDRHLSKPRSRGCSSAATSIAAEEPFATFPTVHVLTYDQLNAYDVLVSDDIVFTKGAIDSFHRSRSRTDTSTDSGTGG